MTLVPYSGVPEHLEPVEVLSNAAMGLVVLYRDTRGGDEVLVRFLDVSDAGAATRLNAGIAEHVARTQSEVPREATHLGFYTDWGVVPFSSNGVERTVTYVMRPFAATRLADLQDTGDVDAIPLVPMATAILRSLHYLHRNSCVHGDLRASNILVRGVQHGHRARWQIVDHGIRPLLSRAAPYAGPGMPDWTPARDIAAFGDLIRRLLPDLSAIRARRQRDRLSMTQFHELRLAIDACLSPDAFARPSALALLITVEGRLWEEVDESLARLEGDVFAREIMQLARSAYGYKKDDPRAISRYIQTLRRAVRRDLPLALHLVDPATAVRHVARLVGGGDSGFTVDNGIRRKLRRGGEIEALPPPHPGRAARPAFVDREWVAAIIDRARRWEDLRARAGEIVVLSEGDREALQAVQPTDVVERELWVATELRDEILSEPYLLEAEVLAQGAYDYEELSALIESRCIVAVRDHGDVLFPVFQFDPASGKVLEAVSTVCSELARRSESPVTWDLAAWWYAEDLALDGSRPIDIVRSSIGSRAARRRLGQRLIAALTPMSA